jgi:hypothetical protein
LIKPTVGRVVWFWPAGQVGTQPNAAIIAFVHSDTRVNLGVLSPTGEVLGETSVWLWDGEGPRPPAYQSFCEWMPYQIGQAARIQPIEVGPMG